MKLRPGLRLQSAVSSTEVIVVRAPKESIDLRCGGVPMTELVPGGAGAERSSDADDVLVGKRYESQLVGVELLCTKSGGGQLSVGDTPLDLKPGQSLPSSD